MAGDTKGSAASGKQTVGKTQRVGKTLQSGDLAAGLYLTATPIGHAQDVSLRALSVLAGVDAIAAEDTRVTSKPKLLARLKSGERIALVSDAGTPLVSDPGFKLVRAAIEEGIAVHAIPGPSAVLTGLMLAGLPSDRFLFAGFLPSRAGERGAILEELKAVRATLIFFESAQRLAETLAQMQEVLGVRTVAVAREMTKLHEDVRRGTLAELAAHYAGAVTPKGEVTLLVGPPHAAAADFGKVDAALDAALEFMPLKPASDMIAALLDMPRKEIYARGLEKKNGR